MIETYSAHIIISLHASARLHCIQAHDGSDAPEAQLRSDTYPKEHAQELKTGCLFTADAFQLQVFMLSRSCTPSKTSAQQYVSDRNTMCSISLFSGWVRGFAQVAPATTSDNPPVNLGHLHTPPSKINTPFRHLSWLLELQSEALNLSGT